MNERIEQLAERAEHYAKQQAGSDWEVEVPYSQKVFRQKFAELIVRECAGVCDDERDSTDSDFGKLVAEGCALKIMEHFGVEE